MLLKLIKYDMKSVSPFLLIIHCALLILYAFLELTDSMNNIFTDIVALAFFLLLFASSFCVHIIMIQRFFQRSFGNEGYLYHSLPATVDQLMLSHGITYVIWNLISQIVLFFMMIEGDFSTLSDFLAGDYSYFGTSPAQIAGLVILVIFVQAILFATFSQMVTSISSFFPTHKRLVLVLGYTIGIIVLFISISYGMGTYYESALQNGYYLSYSEVGALIRNSAFMYTGFCAVFSLINYLVARFILSKHLNLIV